MSKRKKWIWLFLLCLLLAGCSNGHNLQQEEKKLDTGFIPARAGMYDSADTAVIKQINKSKETITFYNLVRERSYTLTYDGTTHLYDKYGSALSMEQVNAGDIVDITFLKEKKKLASIKMSESAFRLEEVARFDINERTKEMRIGDSTYQFEDELLIFSEGKQAEMMDINQVDTLIVQGIDRMVYSVSIDKGHGYLRLKNDEYFWGGWIEVGQEIIRPVEEDMLLVVPEGKYDVVLSTKGITAVKSVTIKRDKETELDIGGLKKEEDQKKFGTLLIAVSPDTAEVYIDGELADISAPCKVEYGIHQLMARAEGYQTITQYIKVGQENAGIEIVMEKEYEKSVSSNSLNSVSGNNAATTGNAKLTIDAPKNVEVYVDGSYVGITPVAFTKTLGVHVITLRADGYVTKSYTINVQDITTNESMSFSELKKEEDSDDEDESKDSDDSKDDDDDSKKEDSKKEDDDSKKKEDSDEEESSKEEDSDDDDKSVSENSADD